MDLRDPTGSPTAALRVDPDLVGRLVESLRDVAILGLDREGRITAWNTGAQTLTGYHSPEVLGRAWSALFSASDRAPGKSRDLLLLAAEEGRAEDEDWLDRKDGSRFWAEVHLAPMHDASGRHVGFSCFARDRTARRRSEDAMRQAYRDVEAFNYSASHDLRAPLRAITTLAEMTLDDGSVPLHAEVRENLQAIAKSAGQCAALIEDLLRFAKASRQELTENALDLDAIVRELALEVQERYHHEVHLTIAGPNPPALADAPLLRILLENVLDNAWKYTQRSASARVEFGSLPDRGADGSATYYVKDNGAGFDEQRASALFEPFQRLHRPEVYAGSGVGLAMVRRIVERHGGRVWAHGAPGEGATIFFALPAGPQPTLGS